LAACIEIIAARRAHLLYQTAKRLGDRLVAIPGGMLINERSSRARMTETGHQLLEARASSSGKRAADVPQVVEVQLWRACLSPGGVPDRAEVGPATGIAELFAAVCLALAGAGDQAWAGVLGLDAVPQPVGAGRGARLVPERLGEPALRAVACDRLRRPLTWRSLTRDRRLRGGWRGLVHLLSALVAANGLPRSLAVSGTVVASGAGYACWLGAGGREVEGVEVGFGHGAVEADGFVGHRQG
jgi:hypothetical protein